jgi:hypothetical protein
MGAFLKTPCPYWVDRYVENTMTEKLTRREFLKVSALGLGSLVSSFAARRFSPLTQVGTLAEFPNYERLGRITVGKIDIHLRPDIDSPVVGALFEDQVVPWLREHVGRHPFRVNQRWLEIPEGFIWSPYVQPVQNTPVSPVAELYETTLGPGMWVEVAVPYVDLVLDNPPARSFWLAERISRGVPPRFYYSQIFWADEIQTDENGKVWYRLNERYGFGDIFYGPAEAFRRITPEEVAPISPDVEDKRVVIDVDRQVLSLFEGNSEVFFCRVSTGAFYEEDYITPLGTSAIWRKMISAHMTGGTTGGGYDLPGIGWTTLFIGNGIAIHSTFWHNDFGVPRSHGCINVQPNDGKQIFRWVAPTVPYDPGDVTVGMPGGTRVTVMQS